MMSCHLAAKAKINNMAHPRWNVPPCLRRVTCDMTILLDVLTLLVFLEENELSLVNFKGREAINIEIQQ